MGTAKNFEIGGMALSEEKREDRIPAWSKRQKAELKDWRRNQSLKNRKHIKQRITSKIVKKNKLVKTWYKHYSEFLTSDYWKDVRKNVLKRDKHTCQLCGSTKQLRVHHKSYKHHGSELKHLDDLVTLCDFCHQKQHSMDLEMKERFNFVMKKENT